MDHLVRFAALEELASLLSAGMELESRLDDLGYRQLREIFLHELLPVSLRLVFDRIKYGLIETDQFLKRKVLQFRVLAVLIINSKVLQVFTKV